MSEEVNRNNVGKEAEIEKQKAVREQLLRVLLTSDARERLTNVKMVRPEVASLIENQIIQLATSGKLRRAVTDEEIKQMLGSVQQKREIRFRWV